MVTPTRERCCEIGRSRTGDLRRPRLARADLSRLLATGWRPPIPFSVKARDARVGRNPRTGEAVEVEQKKVPFFKTGKLLRDRLNGK